ncbi:hypothetical protein PG985_016411 [Apiospora marii]|uniref:Small EDRK-rich factor-like N-terminal domain-containing protein n=1 Tax=Apiospora marii TaxID=335849 RepID=A0ABR1R4Q0_9PEZI
MPSVKNPNGPSKNRQAAMRASAKKKAQKSSAAGQGRVLKSDARRGAREGILPTSGPNRALSAKKQRKLDKARAHALKRKMEAEGEVEMKDAAETAATKEGKEEMDMDAENIS